MPPRAPEEEDEVPAATEVVFVAVLLEKTAAASAVESDAEVEAGASTVTVEVTRRQADSLSVLEEALSATAAALVWLPDSV